MDGWMDGWMDDLTTNFTAALTTATSTIIFTVTDHTSTTHCKKHNKSPSLCTSSGCQEVLETRRPRTGMHLMKKMKLMRIQYSPDPVAQGNVVQKMNNTIFALIIII